MSVVFKCDRCGEIFNRKVHDINDCYGTANSILFLDCTVEHNRFGLGEEPIQLCPSCMKELNDWLEPNEEEYADVVNCSIALDLDDAAFDRMQKMKHEKEARWLSRLEAKENENAECHVICGLFGNIYAGTYAVPCKDDLQMWRSMKEVTSEAIEAVVNHFIIKMEHDGKNKIQKAWGVRGGETLKVTFELSNDKE